MRGFRRLSRTAVAGTVIGALVSVGAVNLLGGSGALAAEDDLVVTGPGRGGVATGIRTFGPTGAAGGVTYGSERSEAAGATVAAGDVTGDGTPEIVTGTGPGGPTRVQVWSKDGKALVAQAEPFPGFNGAVFVATGNVDETPQQEIIVSAGAGGGPHVKALRLDEEDELVEIQSFMAYDPGFHGGVFVSASGGRIITGPGAGGGPHVKVFRVLLGELSVAEEWMAYDPGFTGGVRVAAGSLRDEVNVDVVTGPGAGGGPHLKVWSLDGTEGPGVMAYDPGFRGGIWVGVGHDQHLITGAGAGGGPHVKVMTVDESAFTPTAGFMAYPQTFTGGVHVAGFPATTTPPTSTTACNGVPPLCLPGGEETTTTTAGTGSTTTSTTGATTTTTTPASTTTSTAPTTTTTAPATTTTTVDGTTTTTEACAVVPPLC